MKKIVQWFLFLVCACDAFAQGILTRQIVVPNDLATVEGDSSASDLMTASSFRLQMVFDASQFSSLSSAPGVSNSINQIYFRIDSASTFDVLSVFGGSTIQLSTTTRSPDSLSPVFADNIGGDVRTIYSQGIAFGGSYFAGSSPQPFGNSIILTSPFYYTPAQGNLLLDIAGFGGQTLFPGGLDAHLASGDSISRVFALNGNSLSGTADTLGLVTRFDFTIIPEPSTWILTTMGLVMILLFGRNGGSPHNRQCED